MDWYRLLRRSGSIILATGVLLFLIMVWAENEPGGIPLILVTIGSTMLVLSRKRRGGQ